MQDKQQGKSVFFVSDIRTPKDMATSTHIMTESLLKGLKQNGIKVTFFAICEKKRIIASVVDYYSKIVDCVIPLESVQGVIKGKYRKLLAFVNGYVFPAKYRKLILRAVAGVSKPDVIISHSPSYEVLHFAKALKRYYKTTLYEYWSDPLALSGINPEDFGVKRWPFYVLEKKAFRYADRIIYGTKTLMQFQKRLYPKNKNKMYYIDVPYIHEGVSITDAPKNHLIYAGNYYSNIRNIVPLAQAVADSEGYTLDVYGSGDVDLSAYAHVNEHGRVTPEEMSQIEQRYKNIVCLLNSSCIQIPGKLFYSMNQNTNIIVIADGNHKKELIDYLKEYDRYILCENTPESILEALNHLSEYDVEKFDKDRYSPRSISGDLLNGGNE